MKAFNYILLALLVASTMGCKEASLDAETHKSLKDHNKDESSGWIASLFDETSEKEALKKVDYVAWVKNEENGLRKSKTIGEYTFTIQYLPLDYRALQGLRKERVTAENIEEEKGQLDDLQYFTFQISTTDDEKDLLKTGIAHRDEFYSRVEYFSFDMQNDISLIENGDTIPCTLHHFERTYGIGPFKNFVLAFPKSEILETTEKSSSEVDKTFVFDDHVLGVGKIKIIIRGEDIVSTPILATSI